MSSSATDLTRTLKPRRCGLCGVAFAKNSHVIRHMRVHLGGPKYSCPFVGCTNQYSRLDNLRQHYRCHLPPTRNKQEMRSLLIAAIPSKTCHFTSSPRHVFVLAPEEVSTPAVYLQHAGQVPDISSSFSSAATLAFENTTSAGDESHRVPSFFTDASLMHRDCVAPMHHAFHSRRSRDNISSRGYPDIVDSPRSYHSACDQARLLHQPVQFPVSYPSSQITLDEAIIQTGIGGTAITASTSSSHNIQQFGVTDWGNAVHFYSTSPTLLHSCIPSTTHAESPIPTHFYFAETGTSAAVKHPACQFSHDGLQTSYKHSGSTLRISQASDTLSPTYVAPIENDVNFQRTSAVPLSPNFISEHSAHDQPFTRTFSGDSSGYPWFESGVSESAPEASALGKVVSSGFDTTTSILTQLPLYQPRPKRPFEVYSCLAMMFD